jgi:hypothetical protein
MVFLTQEQIGTIRDFGYKPRRGLDVALWADDDSPDAAPSSHAVFGWAEMRRGGPTGWKVEVGRTRRVPCAQTPEDVALADLGREWWEVVEVGYAREDEAIVKLRFRSESNPYEYFEGVRRSGRMWFTTWSGN